MSNGGTNGLLTVLAELGVHGRADGSSETEQLEMLSADEAMPSMLPAESAARSGPRGGRPRGARNKSTEAWRELFLSRFRHPMMVLGELTACTPAQLAHDLGLYMYSEGKPVLHPRRDAHGQQVYDADGRAVFDHALATGEAAKLQKDAAIALLPYLGQKLPMAIEVTPPKRGVVVIGSLDVPGAESDLAVPFAPVIEVEQNQQVSDADIVRLAGEQSDAEPKHQKPMGDFTDDV